MTGKVILDGKEIKRAIKRIASEIVESTKDMQELALVGIRSGGAPFADRLAEAIEKNEEGCEVPVGYLDVTFYRDDIGLKASQPEAHETDIDFDVEGKIVVLIDDVIHSGRTIRAALDALVALGRPKAIRLAVLVDRGHREYPIQPDYVGRKVPTSRDERVVVNLKEVNGVDEVRVSRRRWENDKDTENVQP